MASSGGVSSRTVVPFNPVRLFLRPLRGATCKDEGVVAHVRGGEIFAGQVRNPVVELVVARCENADTLTFKGMAYRKVGIADSTN